MARARNKLSARTVAALSTPGKYGDGGGLSLRIDREGRRRWAFKFAWRGAKPEMGLGGYPAVSLAAARMARDAAEAQVRAGLNPIDARDAAKRAKAGAGWEEDIRSGCG
jgi:Arm DNA-binding domain